MEEVLIVVGAAYLVLTGIGAAIPRTSIGRWARRVAGDIRGEAKKRTR